jgi:hypothetical protein
VYTYAPLTASSHVQFFSEAEVHKHVRTVATKTAGLLA